MTNEKTINKGKSSEKAGGAWNDYYVNFPKTLSFYGILKFAAHILCFPKAKWAAVALQICLETGTFSFVLLVIKQIKIHSTTLEASPLLGITSASNDTQPFEHIIL